VHVEGDLDVGGDGSLREAAGVVEEDRPFRPDADVPLRTLVDKPFCDGTHATIDFDGSLAN
jgi:hypothetical protein